MMDVAALSMGMSQVKLQQDVGIALTKKVMDNSQQQSNELINMLKTSAPVNPSVGQHIDVSV